MLEIAELLREIQIELRIIAETLGTKQGGYWLAEMERLRNPGLPPVEYHTP